MAMCHLDEDLKQYQAILLNGCATLGAAHVGFLLSLENAKKLRFLKVISGVSIGSIVAMFFLANVRLEKVIQIFRQFSLLSLLQPLDDVRGMINEMGIAVPDKIISLCQFILEEETGIKNFKAFTFKELRKKGRNTDLIIVASQYKANHPAFIPVYFSTTSHPDMPVFDAIRLSINIPILFTTPIYNDHQYLDGVLTDELPFDYVMKHYNITLSDMLAHAPQIRSMSMSDTTTAPRLNPQSLMYVLYTYCLDKIRRSAYPERILHSHIAVGDSISENIASPELIDYFVISAIKATRQYIKHS